MAAAPRPEPSAYPLIRFLRLAWSLCGVLGVLPGILEAVIARLFDADAFERGLRESFQALKNVDA